LGMLPAELKDAEYDNDVRALFMLSTQAAINNPIVGYSDVMPVTGISPGWQPCLAGECPMGNLFADALRWKAGADVGFVTSGGFRGGGWPAGPVHVSDLWDALPFPDILCTGVSSGISLFRLFNYSTAVATFQGAETDNGGRLLQVSGAQVIYNTELTGSRLVAINIWNDTSNSYTPLDRLKLYKFATDSYPCSGYDPYPELLGPDLVIPGEEPGVIGDETDQSVVAEYLAQFTPDQPYNTSLQNRLLNDTSVTTPLDLIETSDACAPGTFWSEAEYSCLNCPGQTGVEFVNPQIEFQGISGSNITSPGSNILLKPRKLYRRCCTERNSLVVTNFYFFRIPVDGKPSYPAFPGRNRRDEFAC